MPYLKRVFIVVQIIIFSIVLIWPAITSTKSVSLTIWLVAIGLWGVLGGTTFGIKKKAGYWLLQLSWIAFLAFVIILSVPVVENLAAGRANPFSKSLSYLAGACICSVIFIFFNYKLKNSILDWSTKNPSELT